MASHEGRFDLEQALHRWNVPLVRDEQYDVVVFHDDRVMVRNDDISTVSQNCIQSPIGTCWRRREPNKLVALLKLQVRTSESEFTSEEE